MSSFLAACAAILVLAIGGWFVLERFQEPAEVAFVTTGVRL